jgi:hypothetical protein
LVEGRAQCPSFLHNKQHMHALSGRKKARARRAS